MWTEKFDKIFLINLDHRTDRLEQATRQLDSFDIPFERVSAISHDSGAEGLKWTVIKIFREAIINNWKNILIFEDDLDILEENFNEIMEAVVKQMPYDYDMILLGGQLCTVPERFFMPNLLKVKNAFATHAVAYSIKGIIDILKSDLSAPIDNHLVNKIQPRGKTYMTYPMLVSQIVTKSDIYSDKPEMNWKPYLEEKYKLRISQMRKRK